MRKVVVLQIGLAVAAFAVVLWIFFGVRPKVSSNAQLQQQLSVVRQKNEALEKTSSLAPVKQKQARQYIHQGVALARQQQWAQAIQQYEIGRASCRERV